MPADIPPPQTMPDGKIRYPIEKPECYEDGVYKFITGYGGGMQTVWYAHVTPEQVKERCEKKVGPGVLIYEDGQLWWEQPGDGTSEAPG